MRSSCARVPERTTTASNANFSESSLCHCSHKCGGHNTTSLLTSPRSSSSRAISPASIVLPIPTSSAMSSLTGSSRRAIISGTSWNGLGRTLIRPNERKGPAPLRKVRRVASLSNRPEVWSPVRFMSGSGKTADSILSIPRALVMGR